MPGVPLERVHEHVEVKLRKCPHCGGYGHMKHVDNVDIIADMVDSEEYDDALEVECESCGMHSGVYETYEKAVSSWNKRKKSVVSAIKNKVLNCAFCGGAANVESAPEDDEECGYIRSDLGLPEGTELFCVKCEECGASTGYYRTAREGIKVWNARV